jgi:hypothetical protein
MEFLINRLVEILGQLGKNQLIDEGYLRKAEITQLLELCTKYNVITLFNKNNTSIVELTSASEDQRKRNCLRSLRQLYECQDLLEAFEHEQINYAVVKGVVLSNSAYNDVGVRKSSDIDILLSIEDLSRAKKLMESFGFKQWKYDKELNELRPFSRKELAFYTLYTHQTAPFVKLGENRRFLCNIDINTSILWGEHGSYTELTGELLSVAEYKDIHGIQLRVLDVEGNFIQLCMHHFKDLNSLYLLSLHANYQLNKYCDIYFFLKKNISIIDMEKVLTLLQKYRLRDYFYFVIFYTNVIFQDSLLEGLLEKFQEVNSSVLHEIGLEAERKLKWKKSFKERILSLDFSTDIYPCLNDEQKYNLKTNQIYM